MGMKVKNTSFSELVVSLPQDRSLTLAARGSAEISREDFASPECQRLFAARMLIVLPETSPQSTGASTAPDTSD
jgi:hypothetical protein